MMTSEQRQFLARLEAFDFDGEPAQLGFAQRLAREHGWSLDFANRVIDEYRRFIFLLACADHPCTPSVAVDQVWHLHLSYSRSYWHRLCRDIVGRPLHHDPTRGGKAEGVKFTDWYEDTLESYHAFFGERPPSDIWPKPSVRFAHPEALQWVDRSRNLVLPRRQLIATAAFLLGLGIAAVVTILLHRRGVSIEYVVLAVALGCAASYMLGFVLHALFHRIEIRSGHGVVEAHWWFSPHGRDRKENQGGCGGGFGGGGHLGCGAAGCSGGCGGGGCGGGGCGGG